MNEAQTKHSLITPALKAAGWDDTPARLALEQVVAPGRVEADGRSHHPMFADYVLMWGARRLAVVEAKSDEKDASEGDAQARFYAEALGVRFAYATNGRRVRSIDLVTQEVREYDTLEAFPAPAELLQVLETAADEESDLEKICREIPWAGGGGRTVRYYQERAVEGVIAAIGRGRKNALVTLATGTGKTFIACQIVHKLVAAKWRRGSIGLRKPRVLFLADRNILADQAMESFSVFPEGECYRLRAATDDPPLDRTVYFTLYQTLLGRGEDEGEVPAGEADAAPPAVKYEKFPRDFFDLVIVDECHRGGANDESAWRAVLDYFASASHLGLTATPKCDDNGSTYEYFGKPVYQYSLKQGIADGFLSPYRVKRCESTLKTWRWVPGDRATHDEEIDKDKYYTTDELERDRIEIKERDRHFVDELFKVMPPRDKAIVFCATQQHALRVTQLIREKARSIGIGAPHYCERVTADDGAIGEMYLRQFRDSDNETPAVLVTSQKLSTGVDACNVRSIVLMKDVKSMVEFKQIVGRGTRVYDGKPGFVIYDFTDATDNFRDPAWDGPVVCAVCGKNPCECGKGGGGGGGGRPKPPKPPPPPCPVCGCSPCVCIREPPKIKRVTLWNGRVIDAFWTDRVIFSGEMLEVGDFLKRFTDAILAAVHSPDELRKTWGDVDRRTDLLEAFDRAGFTADKLRELLEKIGRDEYDVLDVMLDLAYSVEPVMRQHRAAEAQNRLVEGGLKDERFELARVILGNYASSGVWTLSKASYQDLLKQRYGALGDALRALAFRDVPDALAFFSAIQRALFAA
ncbi:MAG: DEAD/DEAH box helicase family protein [Kiritimatiellae bacterium]|nr:DEAD/DEAH box helicase family protein [Kiritimatiellia bacterium]MBQ6245331.1 DEAD/DEAH box helicase family protein [Kiritimatiellia bacterium]